ncbi:MAG: hemK [Actinomycetospora sp.]|nr:hemK [Actinomycetospora sp.]
MIPVVARLRAAGCVFAEEEAAVLADAGGDLDALVARRVAGEPLEQVVGWAAFAGLRVAVAPGVFVPRRRSEFLVTRAVAVVRSAAVVVDVCCGTGAIGAAVLAARPDVVLHAADDDPAAVACACGNLPGAAGVHRSDLLAALPPDLAGRVDVVVASTPYVPTDAVAAMPAEAREHEPHAALDGGGDGLDVVRRLADQAPAWLRADGHLLLECAEHQADAARQALVGAGFAAAIARDEERDATVVGGVLARRGPG